MKHTSMDGNVSRTVESLEKSLCHGHRSEWGLSAETLLSGIESSPLGLVNGSIGVESVAFQGGRALHDYLSNQISRDFPAKSIFTGATLGLSGVTFSEINADPTRMKDVTTSDWKCIGSFNGVSSLLAAERIAAQQEILTREQAIDVTRTIEEYIINEVGNIKDVESANLYSFTDGVTGIVAFGNGELTSTSFMEWSRICVDEMLSRLEYLDQGAFVSDGDRLLPYVANGTAGVLLAMSSLPRHMWPSSWIDTVALLIKAISPRFTLNAGFGEGAAGLIFTAARFSNFLGWAVPISMTEQLVNEILGTRIYEVQGPDGDKMFHVMSEGQMAVSRDLWTGTAGVYVALEEYMRIGHGVVGERDLVRHIFKY